MLMGCGISTIVFIAHDSLQYAPIKVFEAHSDLFHRHGAVQQICTACLGLVGPTTSHLVPLVSQCQDLAFDQLIIRSK